MQLWSIRNFFEKQKLSPGFWMVEYINFFQFFDGVRNEPLVFVCNIAMIVNMYLKSLLRVIWQMVYSFSINIYNCATSTAFENRESQIQLQLKQ